MKELHIQIQDLEAQALKDKQEICERQSVIDKFSNDICKLHNEINDSKIIHEQALSEAKKQGARELFQHLEKDMIVHPFGFGSQQDLLDYVKEVLQSKLAELEK